MDWPVATPEELHMGAPAQDPTANAVYLSFDEVDDDHYNSHTFTVRLKLLTDAAVERYADVHVGFTARHFQIEAIEGRTVHADGTVVRFTGQPFVKVVRENGETFKATVFSMPSVQKGSILEYRYRLAYDDNIVLPAQWFLQQDAFALHEHYIFKQFDQPGKIITLDHGQTSSGLVYLKDLPPGAKLDLPNGVGHQYYELTADNVPAQPTEDDLPPMHALSYRVLFYYAAQMNAQDYWKTQGKFFSKDVNSFASPGPKLRADVATLTAPTDTPEAKARKLYAAAMTLDNSSYLRAHSTEEDQAMGLRPVRTAEDIWERKRGDDDQIAMTYLAMLRAVGIEAYAMKVTNRDRNVFAANFISTSQLDDIIVVAVLNGKEVWLDPGSLYCPFAQLAWPHSWAGGIRQTKDGTEVAISGGLDFRDSLDQRIAQLQLAEDGTASGVVTLRYTGQEALAIRQREAGEATEDTKQRFDEAARRMMPGGTKLHVIEMKNLKDGESPLVVSLAVQGPVVTPTGHRLLLPESILRQDEEPLFTAPARRNPVYFHYPRTSIDVLSIELAPGLAVEELPKPEDLTVLGSFLFRVQVASKDQKLEMKRTAARGATIVNPADYGKMREYYTAVGASDANQILLTRTPEAGKTGTADAHAPVQ